MRKAVVIILVLIIGVFFLFVDVSVESSTAFDFIDKYQSETGHSEFEAEKVFSSAADESGLRLTLLNCQMDSTNLKSFGDIGFRIAKDAYTTLDNASEYNNFIVIFEPRNKAGIKMNEMITVQNLSFSYKPSDFQ